MLCFNFFSLIEIILAFSFVVIIKYKTVLFLNHKAKVSLNLIKIRRERNFIISFSFFIDLFIGSGGVYLNISLFNNFINQGFF